MSVGFMIERFGKPIAMFLVTFLAIRYVTHSTFDGLVVGLIPGILGLANVYVRSGYFVAALSLVVLAVFVLTPASVRDPIAGRITATFNGILHPPTTDRAPNAEPSPKH